MFESFKNEVVGLPFGNFIWLSLFKVFPILCFLFYFKSVLVPFFVAVVLAYIFVSLDKDLIRRGVPKSFSLSLVTLLVVGIFGGVAIYLAPMVWEQSINFAKEVPTLYTNFKSGLIAFIESYLGTESSQVIESVFIHINEIVSSTATTIANYTFGSIMNIGMLALYVIIVPLLTYLFIKDRDHILKFFNRFVTSNSTRETISFYWNKIDTQLANYIQGKLLEILIIGLLSFGLFTLLGLKYSALLATAVGLSVLIPYIGAFSVSVPIIAVSLSQWGLTSHTYALLGAYFLLQIIDGNVLVPMIFSEKMNLHPIAILLAVFIFGYAGGIIGVFFSIPLLALMKVFVDKNYPVKGSSVLTQ